MRPFVVRWVLAHALVTAVLAAFGGGCSDEEEASDDSGTDRREPKQQIRGPIHLVDRLAGATIDSPLQRIERAERLTDLDIEPNILLQRGFEKPDAKSSDWPLGPEDEARTVDGRRVLVVRGHSPELLYDRLPQPIQASSYYRLVYTTRADNPLFASYVLDTRDGWQERAVSLLAFRTPGGVRLREHRGWPPGWKQVNRVKVPLDRVRLERYSLDRKEQIALIKGRALARGARPGLGMHKYARFGETWPGPGMFAEENFSYRHALYAPPNTEVMFPLRVPEGGRLRVSTMLTRDSRLGSAARFEVLVDDGSSETTLHETTRFVSRKVEQWQQLEVDLSRYAGDTIELVLRTRALRGAPHPLWGNPVAFASSDEAQPRDIIFIAIDTLRADRLSCYGYEKPTTPHIEEFADDGVLFEQAITSSNWTTPSFASIFTGAVPSRHGVFSAPDNTPIPKTYDTLAERFRAHGWSVESVIFKVMLDGGGMQRGYDRYLNVRKGQRRADNNVREALEWLRDRRTTRNFLFLHLDDPHQPYNQAPPFVAKFHEGELPPKLKLPARVGKPGSYTREFLGLDKAAYRQLASDLYDGEVGYVDDRLGTFFEALKEQGLYERSTIVLVSDHGESLWDRGNFHGHMGVSLYDELIRVPLILKPADGVSFEPGRRVQAQVRVMDVMPTLLELGGIKPEDVEAAKSLVPYLKGDPADHGHRLAFAESSSRSVALRTGQWKYVLYSKPAKPREQLFELSSDPQERNDLSGERPKQLLKYRHMVLDYILYNKPARFLVVRARNEDPTLRVEGAGELKSIFGTAPEKKGKREWEIPRSVNDRQLAGVYRLGNVQKLTVGGANWSEIRPATYAKGQLRRWLEMRDTPLLWVRGRSPPDGNSRDGHDMDAADRRALRALGYVQ